MSAVTTDRAVWLPGTPPPAHLDGTLPGDFGFDPLNLGTDKSALSWCAIGAIELVLRGAREGGEGGGVAVGGAGDSSGSGTGGAASDPPESATPYLDSPLGQNSAGV